MSDQTNSEEVLFTTRSFRPLNWGIILLAYFVLLPFDINSALKFLVPVCWVFPLILFELKYAVFYSGNIEFRYPLNPFEPDKYIKYSAIIELRPLPALRSNTRFRIIFMKGKDKEMATFYPYAAKERQELLIFLNEKNVKIKEDKEEKPGL